MKNPIILSSIKKKKSTYSVSLNNSMIKNYFTIILYKFDKKEIFNSFKNIKFSDYKNF